MHTYRARCFQMNDKVYQELYKIKQYKDQEDGIALNRWTDTIKYLIDLHYAEIKRGEAKTARLVKKG